MKGPMPTDYETLYVAMAPVVANLQSILNDISSNPKRDSRYCWEALSYQAKALAARVDYVVETDPHSQRTQRLKALRAKVNDPKPLWEQIALEMLNDKYWDEDCYE